MPVAMLPSRTTRVPLAETSGERLDVSPQWNGVTVVAGGDVDAGECEQVVARDDRVGRNEPAVGGNDERTRQFAVARPKAFAYASFPRKYKPLKKLNTSPSGAPSLDSRRASSKSAFGLSNTFARRPSHRAGERRKTCFTNVSPDHPILPPWR